MVRNKLLITCLALISFIVVRAEESKYGKEISLKEKTPITDILANPENFDGKAVLVEGEVVAVCQNRGCWIDIASGEQKIKVKVEDGVIVFPSDAKGKTALVEAVVAPVKEEACSTEKATCSTTATTCQTEKTACQETKQAATGCCTSNQQAKVYQLEGLGAVIR